MSKHINVNPDHYKVAGRERQGEHIVQEQERQQFSGGKAHAERAAQRGPHIPGQERASTPARPADEEEEAQEVARDASAGGQESDGTPALSDDEGMID